MPRTRDLVDVSELRFPELRPLDLNKSIDTHRCFDTTIDPVSGVVLLCTRAKRHGGRHSTGDGTIITRVWR